MRVRAATALAIVLAATLAGCAGATPTPPSPTPGAVTPSQPGASPATTPSGGSPGEPGTTSGPRATASDPAGTPEATLEPPPDATLVSGGVEQTGVPGGYTWRGGAESAPWLPAAALEGVTASAGRVAIAVGAVALLSAPLWVLFSPLATMVEVPAPSDAS